MEQQLLQELEAAARIILAPPATITNQQRMEAEKVFLNFRISKCPYNACKYIFETTKIDYVIFETTNTLKEAVIREWKSLRDNDVISLWQYLLQHVINSPNIAVFVREKMLQVVAIIVKRGSIADKGQERGKLLGQVERLILSGDMRQQIIGFSLISALMQEYSNTVKSADIGLTWETHLTAKREFETTDLKSIFKLCTRVLNEIRKMEGTLPENMLTLLKSLLQISEGILSWSFASTMPNRLICIFEISYESDYNLSLKLTPAWKDILDPDVVKLFFVLHWKIRDNPNLSHYTMNCLVQLASLNGPIFTQRSTKVAYVTNYMECFLQFLDSIEVFDSEALGVSTIVVKALLFYNRVISNDLPQPAVFKFFQHLARLTCHFASGAVTQEGDEYEDSLFTEAFDNMLKAWITLWSDNPAVCSDSFFNEAATGIFDSYLKWHLAPPYGNRRRVTEREISEVEEEDIKKYDCQLESVCLFNRLCLKHALPTLAKTMDARTRQLRAHIQALSGCGTEGSLGMQTHLEDLYEDLHWLVMIAGHTLARNSDAGIIPDRVMEYSVGQSDAINVEDSLRLLTMLDHAVTDEEHARMEQSVDHVLWLVSSVFRLSYLEKTTAAAKLMDVLSPTLTCTITWFLHVWSRSYLLFKVVSDDERISPTLKVAFGEWSDCCNWTLSLLLDKIRTNFLVFNDDGGIVEYTAKLLYGLFAVNNSVGSLVHNASFWSEFLKLVAEVTGNDSVCPEINKILLNAFATGLATEKDGGKRTKYLKLVATPYVETFLKLVHDDHFGMHYQDEITKRKLTKLLQCFIGLTEGAQYLTSRQLMEYFEPILRDLASLSSVYHNYSQIVELIITIYGNFSRNMLSHLSQRECQIFYASCMRLVDFYSKHNVGRVTTAINAVEDVYHDILCFMVLLTNLTYEKFEVQDRLNDVVPTDAPQLSSVDVCMFGMRAILPLMTVNLLRIPSFSDKFYNFLSLMGELHIDAVMMESLDSLTSVLALMELGLTAFGSEITLKCCFFLRSAGEYLFKNKRDVDADKQTLLQPFLKIMLTIVLSKQLTNESVGAFGDTFYTLICCYKEVYTRLVEELVTVSCQMDPDKGMHARMTETFGKLTQDLTFRLDRNEKVAFEGKFEKFVADLQGFLLTK